MLSVDEALEHILAETAQDKSSEALGVGDAFGRVLAADAIAATTQPPFDASAMDGYAVRFSDAAAAGGRLKLIGECRAGEAFSSPVAAGEAVRIFTGGVVPDGADHIVIQEDTEADGETVTVSAEQVRPRHIRAAGIDFHAGDTILSAGKKLSAYDISLAAAANLPELVVARRPVVAYFDNGDELAEPGATLGPGQIVGSNRFGLHGLIEAWGGAPRYLGRADDSLDAMRDAFERGADTDIIVPVGGASVGDYDHGKDAFAAAGGKQVFSKIAVRPGKPTWFGRMGKTRVLGLPGNPASSFVCAVLFLRPLIAALLGASESKLRARAPLAEPLGANGGRESYLRAAFLEDGKDGRRIHAFDNQDSSLLRPFSAADALIRREPNAPAAAEGDLVDILYL